MVCVDCRAVDMHLGRKDFLSDKWLMYLVATGKLPKGVSEVDTLCLTDAASNLQWDGARLWFIGNNNFKHQIPSRWHRRLLMRDIFSRLGYRGGRHLYALLKVVWYWKDMLTDCIQVCKDALPC